MTPRHIIVKLLKTSNKGENVKAPERTETGMSVLQRKVKMTAIFLM